MVGTGEHSCQHIRFTDIASGSHHQAPGKCHCPCQHGHHSSQIASRISPRSRRFLTRTTSHRTFPDASSKQLDNLRCPHLRRSTHTTRSDTVKRNLMPFPRRGSFSLSDAVQWRFQHVDVQMLAIFSREVRCRFKDTLAGGDAQDVGHWHRKGASSSGR